MPDYRIAPHGHLLRGEGGPRSVELTPNIKFRRRTNLNKKRRSTA